MPQATITREQAESLAVRYQAYLEAKTPVSVRVWGRMLLESIEATGAFADWAGGIRTRVEFSEEQRDQEAA